MKDSAVHSHTEGEVCEAGCPLHRPPEPMGEPFGEYLKRITPRFAPCTKCGVLTSGGGVPLVCWDCTQRQDRSLRAAEMLEGVVPAAFAWSSFASPLLAQRCAGGAQAIQRARECASASRVILVGASGTGKTSLAVAMLRLWVEDQRIPAHFALATDLASARTRATMGREAQEVTEATNSPLLLLDDLGTDGDVPRSAVTEVIFKRHAEQRPIWVTTWLDPDKAAAKYGEGIARRLYEGAKIIDCSAGARAPSRGQT